MNRKHVFQKHKILPTPHLRSVYRAIKSESCIVIKPKAHVQYISVLCCWCSHHFMYSTGGAPACESVNAGNTSFTPLQRSNLYPSLPVHEALQALVNRWDEQECRAAALSLDVRAPDTRLRKSRVWSVLTSCVCHEQEERRLFDTSVFVVAMLQLLRQ